MNKCGVCGAPMIMGYCSSCRKSITNCSCPDYEPEDFFPEDFFLEISDREWGIDEY